MSRKVKINLFDCPHKPYGCRICGGELVPALYSERVGEVPEEVSYAFYSEGTGRTFLRAGDGIYVSDGGEKYTKISAVGGADTFAAEDIADGAPRAVIVTGTKATLHGASSFTTVLYGANLGCGIMHCGRLFGADADDAFKLRWSGEGGISDWTEGVYGSGSLQLDPKRGAILGVCEYGEKLVIVRKYGLTVANMFGSPENFSVDITDTDTERIIGGTAVAVGGKLVFAGVSGLYAYDGSEVKTIYREFPYGVSEPKVAVGFAGRYYLACKSSDFSDGCILCYDPADGISYVIGGRADAMCAGDKIYLYGGTGKYRLKEGARYSCSFNVDFGSASAKTLTALYVHGGKADVTVSVGNKKRTFANAEGKLRPRMRGRTFKVTVTGYSALTGLAAEAEVADEI